MGSSKQLEKSMMAKLTEKEVVGRIKTVCGDIVVIDFSTYAGVKIKARFIDKDFGEFWIRPGCIFRGRNHPKRGIMNRKKTMLRLYGVENPSQSQAIKDKKKVASQKKYGTDCVLQAASIKKKIKATVLEKYGVENPSQSQMVKDKKVATYLKNFGVENPMQSKEVVAKANATNIERYGVPWCQQNHEISLKGARTRNESVILLHWKTQEELVCVGSYEIKTVEYLNSGRIDFEWQPKTFMMPDGKTYRPDFYLTDTDTWVEIKGFFYEDAKFKWSWFQQEYPKSELWGRERLKEIGVSVR